MSDLTKEFSFFFPLGLLAKRWTRIYGIIPFYFCNFLSHQAEHKRRHSPGIILFYLWSIYHLSRVNRKSTKLRLLRPLELLLAFFSFFFFFSFHGKKTQAKLFSFLPNRETDNLIIQKKKRPRKLLKTKVFCLISQNSNFLWFHQRSKNHDPKKTKEDSTQTWSKDKHKTCLT